MSALETEVSKHLQEMISANLNRLRHTQHLSPKTLSLINSHVFVYGRVFSTASPTPPDEATAAILAKMDEQLAQSQKTVSPWMISDLPHIRTADFKVFPGEAGTVSGMPTSHAQRKVFIRQLAKSAMTSGLENTKAWVLSWKPGKRWTNPLMGWTSTNDPLACAELKFDTPEQAVAFCEKQGWPYELASERYIYRAKQHRMGEVKYAHNFLPENIERDLKKNGLKTKVFERDAANASHFHKYLKFHGDGDVGQHGPNPLGLK